MSFPSSTRPGLFSPADFVVRSARLKNVSYKENDSGDESLEDSPEIAQSEDSFVRKGRERSQSRDFDINQIAQASDSDDDSDESCDDAPSLSSLTSKRKKTKRELEQTTPLSKRAKLSNAPFSPLNRTKPVNSPPVIKQEEGSQARQAPKTYVLQEISPDATLLSEEMIVCSIDDDGVPHFSTKLNPKASYWVRRDWDKPAPNAHELFPLQELGHSGSVIKALQDPKDSRYCRPGIKVKNVIMSPETEENYKTLLRHKGKDYTQSAIDRKKAALKERLQAVIDRNASEQRSYDTHDVVLNGKQEYGLKATEDIPSNSKQVDKQDWAYKGFFYDSANKAEAERYLFQQYGARFEEYVEEIKWTDPLTGDKRKSYIAALGSGGHMHNANTVLKKKGGLDGYLDYDLPKINLAFEHFTVVYELPDEKTVAYPHVDQAPIPNQTIRAGDGLFVCYAADFLNMLRKKMANPQQEKKVYIKKEVVSDDEDFSSRLQSRPDKQDNYNPFSLSEKTGSHNYSHGKSSSDSPLSSAKQSDSGKTPARQSETNATKHLDPLAKSLKAQLPSLTSDWESVSGKQNALAAAQTRIDHPDWSQDKIVEALRAKGMKCSQTSLSRWGISPLSTPTQALLEEATSLKEKLPSLSAKWLSTVHREKANTAARLRLENPDWSQPEIVLALKKKGFDVAQQTLSKWGIPSKLLLEADQQESLELKKKLPYLTNFWVNSRQRKEANAAARLHLKYPSWTAGKISRELEKQQMEVSLPTLNAWGIALSKTVATDDLEESIQLKQKLTHLTAYWDNTNQRKEANLAARMHLKNPSWTASRIQTELKQKHQIAIPLPTLTAWGISSTRHLSEEDLQEAEALKKELPHLTSIWTNARQRKEANAAAKIHLRHPDWLPTQIIRELQKQGIKLAPTTLLSWGISPKLAASFST